MNDRTAPRMTGILTVITAAAIIVGVFARVAAGGDADTLRESLQAIAANRAPYSIYGALTLLSGIAMMGAAWLIASASAFRALTSLPIVPLIFGVAGAIYVLSGASAVFLASVAPNMAQGGMASQIREISATAAFIVSGWGLIASGFYQWKAGPPLKFMAPVSVIIGALMQVMLVRLATSEGIAFYDQIIGLLFVIWLFIAGFMLAFVPTERLSGGGLRTGE